MKKTIKNLTLAISLMLPALFCYADYTIAFDTITSFKSGKVGSSSNAAPNSSITGIEKDTGNTRTAIFGSQGNDYTGLTVGSICTPLVLTAMEKPGRYYLHVSWSTAANSYKQVTYCMLELKGQPE